MRTREQISAKALGRLCIYRRLLNRLRSEGVEGVYSHELAEMAGGSAAQVRRDLMAIGYSGSPTKGYSVDDLFSSIGDFIDTPEGQRVAIVGIGNMGRALLSYFSHRRPKLHVVAAFDKDPQKTGRVINGCRCHTIDQMHAIIKQENVTLGVITVPAANAQDVADEFIAAGIRGLLNFAPVRLRVPPHVYVEDLDVTMSLEKVAYYAYRGNEE